MIGRHRFDVFPDLPLELRDIHQRALQCEVLSAEDALLARADGRLIRGRWKVRP